MRAGRSAGWLLAVLCLVAPLEASADRWTTRLERLEADLDQGAWDDVLKDSVKLRRKMIKRVDEAAELVLPAARTLVFQAIAEANLGRDDDARWHWYAAQSYLDGLPALDLGRYGRAGEVFGGLEASEALDAWRSPAPAEGDKARYREVRVRRSVPPDYPKALRRSKMQGKIHLEIVIDQAGRAHRPRVLDGGLVPTMAFPVLDAVPLWVFEPAHRGQQAVAVVYELNIDYK